MIRKHKIALQNHEQRYKGQSIIELALTLPLLVMIVLGVMDLGRLFYTKIVLTNAAREGANYLAYFCEDDTAVSGTYDAIKFEADSSNVDYDSLVIEIPGSCAEGEPIEISVSTTVDLLFYNIFRGLFNAAGWPEDVILTGRVRMVVQ